MTLTLPAPDAVDAPDWTIRPEQAIDLDLIHDLHREAFHRRHEAELVDAIRSGPDFLPELSLVAVTRDGSVLGHVLISRVSFHPDIAQGTGQTVLALAPLAVLPPYQGSGIGSALMRDALAIADEHPEPFVAVLGSPAFYSRFGFEPAAADDIHGPYDEAGDAFQVRRRPGVTQLAPGVVVYPPKFEAV
jgi:putative acetyltransferase